MSLICDKCGQPVEPANDAARLSIEMGNIGAVIAIARHLLPVVDGDGKIQCEGSPSRAQYLEGQPRDKRAQYPYNPELESQIRAAHQAMLARIETLNT